MMFLYGVLIIIGNFIISMRIRKIDSSTNKGKLLIEVASLVLLIVSFILYIILIS
jgi:hypothetical protein